MNCSRSRPRSSIGIVLLLIAVSLPQAGLAADSQLPAARVTAWAGTVEYSNDRGSSWRPVEWRKYLLPGYRLRTGADGTATLQRLPDREQQQVGVNTVVEVEPEEIHLWSGELSAPRIERGSTTQALWARFQLHQRFMSTRRSHIDWHVPERAQLARTLKVDRHHPEVVWHHAGPGYGYRLVVGEQSFEIAPMAAPEFIRFSLPELPPGEYDARVSVLYGDEVVFEPRRSSKLIWSDRRETRAHQRQRKDLADDPASLAAWQLDNHYRVAAMDTLRDWHQQHPHSREIRPLLAVAYGELRLGQLQGQEREAWDRTAP